MIRVKLFEWIVLIYNLMFCYIFEQNKFKKNIYNKMEISYELEEFKSNKYVKMNNYKTFISSKINYNWGCDDTKLNKLHIKIETNKSNSIEGIRTTIEKYLVDTTEINLEKEDDWEEVQNYVKANNYGVEKINNGFSVCTRLILC